MYMNTFFFIVCALQVFKLHYIFYTYTGTTWLEFLSLLSDYETMAM